jgi:hypothetical protein
MTAQCNRLLEDSTSSDKHCPHLQRAESRRWVRLEQSEHLPTPTRASLTLQPLLLWNRRQP